MSERTRYTYTVSNGKESFTGYLFTDNVKFWEDRGYTVTRTS